MTKAESEAGPQSQLKNVIKEIASLADRLLKQRSNRDDINDTVKATELEVNELARQRRTLKKEQQQLDRRLLELEAEHQQLQNQLQSQQELIGEQLKVVHQNGQHSALQQLLQQKNPAQWDRQITYLAYINEARSELIENYQSTIESKQSVVSKIEAERLRKQKNQQQLATKNIQLNQLQAQRGQQLAKLKEEIQSDEDKIAQLHTDRETLKQLIINLSQTPRHAPILSRARAQEAKAISAPAAETEIIPASNFAQFKGALSWPVVGQHRFKFGAKRSNSDIKWQGETIVASSGSEVKAIHSGRVIFADWFKGQGLLTIIDHGEGYMSLYAHNESLLYDVGSWVNKNEPIATVGNSGGQALAALYFEIRHHGVPANPSKWCQRQG